MKFLKANWGLKLISVFLALMLWLAVVNVSKPEITDSRTVELEILNQSVFESGSKAWEVDRNTVSVSYSVRTDQRSNITANDLRAYIDLEDYSITGSVPVYVEVLNNKDSLISNVTARPSVIRVNIEDIQEKQFDLTVNHVGTQADGYSIANVIISPETVYVTGPESSIGRISEVGINIDINNISESISGVAEPIFYDANGNVINGLSGVSLSNGEINYSVTVHKKKSINLLSSIRGIPAAGYQYESMTVSPDSIQLSAASSIIDSMTVFELPSIDITGATGSITQTFRIEDYLPAGIELAEPNGEVNITVRIEKIPETETTAVVTSAENTVQETNIETESISEEGRDTPSSAVEESHALSEASPASEDSSQETGAQ